MACARGRKVASMPVPQEVALENSTIERIGDGPRVFKAQLRNNGAMPIDNKTLVVCIFDSQGYERGDLRLQLPTILPNSFVDVRLPLDEQTQGFRIVRLE